MNWTPLPTGEFTGIAWSRPEEASGMDPYLAWLEAIGFTRSVPGRTGTLPQQLPLIIELQPGKTVADLAAASAAEWLSIPAVYTDPGSPAGLRYCTARVKPQFFREFRRSPLREVIARFELGLAAGSRPADTRGQSIRSPATAGAAKLAGKVMAIIDGGLAFANTRFLRMGRARTKYFWRQDDEGSGCVPADLGYGHELTGGDIDAAMDRYRGMEGVDEAAVYEHFALHDLRRRVNHGTHVLDLACGPMTLQAQTANLPPGFDAPPSWEPANDEAARCDIVAVQLDWHTILDTSGGSMNVHIMDGLMYILSRCEPHAKIAVNISWGTLAGPHDGSSILEAAMDQLIDLRGQALEIMVPAGNSYQSCTHANATLAPSESASLTWCVQADDHTQSFLELWIATPTAASPKASVRVTPSGCAPLPWMALGDSGMWTDAAGTPLCALIFPDHVATGTTGTCALLALAPSASFDHDTACVPCGPWTVEISNDGVEDVTFDAYIERDDIPLGVSGHGGRQSCFSDHWYDTSGNPDSFVDHPDNPTLIRRSGNFNSLSTGKNTTRVGGTRVSDGSWALYSPRIPDPDASRPQRPNVVKEPDTSAGSDESAASVGVAATGTISGSIVKLAGTSSAAPQVTRRKLNAM
jgi:hypothetical protein